MMEENKDLEQVETFENVAQQTEQSVVQENETRTTYTSNLKEIDLSNEEAKWYILHTFTGYEATAKQNLENVVENGNLHHRILNIVIPEQEVVEIKDGKQKIKRIKTMPSYLFIKMVYGDDLWHTIVNSRGVTGFVGPKGRPLPMTQDEIRRLHLENIEVDFKLEIGETVEIIDGPLQSYSAKVVSDDPENKRCKVLVNMFGRDTETELLYDQIRKLI